MKRVWIALLGAIVIASTWVGASQASTSNSQAFAPLGKVKINIKGCTAKGTVTFMFWGDKGDKAAQDASIALAEKDCPGLKVNEIWDPGNYDTDLATKIGSGNAPDLFQLDASKRVPEYVSEGALQPVDSYIKADKLNMKKVFWAQCVNELTYKGHVYGLPRTCGNQSMLYYNKEMFKARGVAFPTNKWTYKNFEKAAIKLSGTYSVPNDPTSKLRFGYAFNNDDFRIQQYMWDWGGDWVNAALNKCELTEPASRAGLQWWYNLRVAHGAPNAAQASGLPGYFDGWQKEVYAMSFMGAWALDYAIGKTPGGTPLVHFPWGAVLNPMGPKNRQAVMAATSEQIYAHSKNKNAAWWLARFVTEGPGAVLTGAYGVDTPGDKALWKAPAVKAEFGNVLATAYLANKTGRYPHLVPQYDKWVSTITSDLDPFWKGTESVQAATTQACNDVKSQGLLLG